MPPFGGFSYLNTGIMQIFICYKTDNCHSFKSRDLIGVSKTLEGAIKLCKQQSKKEQFALPNEQLFNLRNSKQTQGYRGEGEFFIEPTQTGILM